MFDDRACIESISKLNGVELRHCFKTIGFSFDKALAYTLHLLCMLCMFNVCFVL
jgi:hypothetical protein